MEHSIAYEPESANILLAILATMGEEAIRKQGRDRIVFKGHNREWHNVICHHLQRPKWPILDCFVFADNGPELFSPILDAALLVTLHRFDAGDWELFAVTRDDLEYFDKEIKPGLTPDDLRQIGEIATELKRIRMFSPIPEQ